MRARAALNTTRPASRPGEASAPIGGDVAHGVAKVVPQHLLLFHPDPPTAWLKTVALGCGARGLERLGQIGFKLLWVQRPDLAGHMVQQNAPEAVDWALVPAERKVTDYRMLACDMDATLIENECVDELAALLPDPAPVLALTRAAMDGRIAVEESLRRRIDAMAGMPERAIEAILSGRIAVRPGTERLMRLARTAGWPIVMVTGGFSQFAQPIARRLGITEVYCNSLDIEDERLKGTFSGNILDGPSKALVSAAVAKRLNLRMRQIVALGDGANDADLMRNAGLAVGIRPKPVIEALATHSLHHAPLDAVWYLAGGSS
ncbi:MAG: phosphoserine phosphatase SerB [Rhodocyclaceae bacterium]|nr:phosphoserine phosphatase SerB [Rhodocyclaceae bacterium]